MTASKRYGLYAFLGALGGLLAFVLSLPIFPHKTLGELIGPIGNMTSSPESMQAFSKRLEAIPPQTTLGTPYGNLAYFLLGAFVCSFLVLSLRTERQSFWPSLGFAMLAFVFGGVLTRAADALSDYALVHRIVPREGSILIWGLLVGMAMSHTIWLFQGPTVARWKRAAVAGLIAAFVSCAVRMFMAPAIAVALIPSMFEMISSDPNAILNMDLWAPMKPEFLVQYTTMSLALGVCFAFVEAQYRKGSLRWEAGRNENKEWELHPLHTIIGTGEVATVRLPKDPGVAANHAVIAVQNNQYVLHIQPGMIGYVNGVPAGIVQLMHGDRIQVGSYTLTFLDANLPRDYVLPTAPVHLAPAASPAWAVVETPHFGLEELDGHVINLAPGSTVIGRDPGSTIVLNVQGVSRHHAEIVCDGQSTGIRDLGSTNGTMVNGQRVTEHVLAHGDKIDIAGIRYVYLIR